jgi:hypothetical protein
LLAPAGRWWNHVSRRARPQIERVWPAAQDDVRLGEQAVALGARA